MKLEQWIKTELGQNIWEGKYRYNKESFDEWLERVSGGDTAVKDLIEQKKFLFGGRILASRGVTDRKVTYSNCYVLPQVEDSIEGIYDTAKHLARTFSYGGGVGIDISKLRPKGAPVNNAAKTTSGAVSFMDTFSQVSSVIGQEGRRGALMISMDCYHRDIGDFIDAKKNTDKLEGCNISVRCSDKFMEDSRVEDETFNMMMKLAENNWNYAEPGILYWDTINDYNLLTQYIKNGEFEYAGVNPCAEEPLPAGGSCLLGAMNLSEYVEQPFTDKAAFNLVEFRHDVKIAIKALNDVLDEGLELHPLEIQRETVRDWRQIGRGIMGFADMLIKLGIPYGSGQSITIIHKIGKAMNDAGLLESARLAKEKGAFVKCDNEKILKSTFMQHIKNDSVLNAIESDGLRNSQLFTIAPTGSISTMLGVSGGVEPLFDIAYTRTTKSLHGEDKDYVVVTPIVEECLKAKGMEFNTMDPKDLPKEIVWSKVINPMDRVDVQATWQDYIDASISSTVNLAEDTTVEQVYTLYLYAWSRGCKGLTIFRDGCARTAILNSTTEKKEEPKEEVKSIGDLSRGEWEPIPDDTMYVKRKVYTGCGKINLFIGFSPSKDRVVEVYVKRSGKGGCEHNIDGEVIAMSGMLRLGGTLDTIEKAYRGLGACPSFTRARERSEKLSKGKSCPSAILNVILETEKELQGQPKRVTVEMNKDNICVDVINNLSTSVKCPNCGEPLQMTGGCNVCPGCGYTKCD